MTQLKSMTSIKKTSHGVFPQGPTYVFTIHIFYEKSLNENNESFSFQLKDFYKNLVQFSLFFEHWAQGQKLHRRATHPFSTLVFIIVNKRHQTRQLWTCACWYATHTTTNNIYPNFCL